jgi:hypothetical protein
VAVVFVIVADLRKMSKEGTRSSNEKTIGDVAYWPFATFIYKAAFRSPSEGSGHQVADKLGWLGRE